MPKTDLSTENLRNQLQSIQNQLSSKQDGGKKKRASKKTSKKTSKKGSKAKASRMIMMDLDVENNRRDMEGGKRKSKKTSKKTSKKGSKKGSMKGGKKELPPALKAAQVVNEKILKEAGADRKHWFGLITYVNTLRKKAKTTVKDEKDFKAVNAKIVELFEDELDKKGKNKIAEAIENFYEEAMAKRKKRGSKK